MTIIKSVKNNQNRFFLCHAELSGPASTAQMTQARRDGSAEDCRSAPDLPAVIRNEQEQYFTRNGTLRIGKVKFSLHGGYEKNEIIATGKSFGTLFPRRALYPAPLRPIFRPAPQVLWR